MTNRFNKLQTSSDSVESPERSASRSSIASLCEDVSGARGFVGDSHSKSLLCISFKLILSMIIKQIYRKLDTRNVLNVDVEVNLTFRFVYWPKSTPL